ncbi:Co-chaperone [Dispira parvispora]|uniref:Co-chaperone n=1 Tax=Dispira parvispora TaxID=1520584 RepID=A0A9W8E5L4_9FUNG|nr:Co-chaperone [Dispira parvispora]
MRFNKLSLPSIRNSIIGHSRTSYSSLESDFSWTSHDPVELPTPPHPAAISSQFHHLGPHSRDSGLTDDNVGAVHESKSGSSATGGSPRDLVLSWLAQDVGHRLGNTTSIHPVEQGEIGGTISSWGGGLVASPVSPPQVNLVQSVASLRVEVADHDVYDNSAQHLEVPRSGLPSLDLMQARAAFFTAAIQHAFPTFQIKIRAAFAEQRRSKSRRRLDNNTRRHSGYPTLARKRSAPANFTLGSNPFVQTVDEVECRLDSPTKVSDRWLEIILNRLYSYFYTMYELSNDHPERVALLELLQRAIRYSIRNGIHTDNDADEDEDCVIKPGGVVTGHRLSQRRKESRSSTWVARVLTQRGGPEAFIAVDFALREIFGFDAPFELRGRIVEQARGAIEACLEREDRLLPSEHHPMYQLQTLLHSQSPPTSIGNLEDTAKPFKNRNYKPARRYRNLKQVLTSEKSTEYPLDFPTWWSTEAPPSVLPRPKYCDITGYEAPYTDPKTNLRYCNAQVYQYIQQLPPGTEQQYLELRNAHVVLK